MEIAVILVKYEDTSLLDVLSLENEECLQPMGKK
jgi:hypothetical protein